MVQLFTPVFPARAPIALALALAASACASQSLHDPSEDATPYALEQPKITQYIAFGDSFVSGVGASDVQWEPCGTSRAAWPYRVQEGLQIPELVFAACSGATTQDVLGTGRLQMAAQLSQLPAAGELDSALITITIGGNDIKLDERLAKCLNGSQPSSSLGSLSGACGDLKELLDTATTVVNDALAPSLDETFKTLREAAPNATIVAVGYPHLVDANGPMCDATLTGKLIDRGNRGRMNELADAINAQIAASAARAGIASVTDDVVAAFAGHEACSADEWIVSPDATLRTGNLGVAHPNETGHQVYANAVIAALRR